jgi:hypothetical protein
MSEIVDKWVAKLKDLPNVGTMTHAERLLKLFNLEEADMVGVAPELDYYQILYAGYDFYQAWESPEVGFDATMKQWADFRMDLLWPYMTPADYIDFLMTPEQRQTHFNLRDGKSYVAYKEIGYDLDGCIDLFTNLRPWDKYGFGRFASNYMPNLEWCVEFSEKMGKSIPVALGFCAPSNAMEFIPGVQNFVKWTVTENKAKMHKYAELVTELYMTFPSNMKSYADRVVVTPCLFGGGRTWGPKQLEEFGKYDEMWVKEVVKYFPNSFWHVCGKNLPHAIEWLTTLPIKAVQYDEPMAQLGWSWPKWTEWVARVFKGKLCAMNSPTTQMLLNGKPHEVERMVKEFIDHTTPHTTAVIMPGCEPSSSSPVENIRAMIDTGRNYGKYPECRTRGTAVWEEGEFEEMKTRFQWPRQVTV